MGTDYYSLNKVVLVGRTYNFSSLLTRNKVSFFNFVVTTREIFLYGSKKGTKPTNFFHNIQTWGKLAEFCKKYLKDGDLVIVEGKQRNFPVIKKDKEKVWKTVIQAEQIILLQKKEWQEHKKNPEKGNSRFK